MPWKATLTNSQGDIRTIETEKLKDMREQIETRWPGEPISNWQWNILRQGGEISLVALGHVKMERVASNVSSQEA